MNWLLMVDLAIGVYVAAFVVGALWLFGIDPVTLAAVTVITVLATMFVLMLVQGGARVHVKEEK